MRGYAILATSLLAAPAAKADLAHCHLLLDLTGSALGQRISADVAADPNGGCLFSDVRLPGSPHELPLGWLADRVSVRGEGLDGFIDQMQIPHALKIEVHNLRPAAPFGDPLEDWLFDLQQLRSARTLRLDYDWDRLSAVLTVNEAFADFGGDNRVRFSGTITGVDILSVEAPDLALQRVALTELSAEVSSYGLFEEQVLPVLARLMLAGSDEPALVVAGLQADAEGRIASAPETVIDAASRSALVEAVRALPAPSGILRLHLTAEPGLGAVRFLPLVMAGNPLDPELFWTAMGGVVMQANWDTDE